MDLGWGILRYHWFSLATRYYEPTPILSRAHWLLVVPWKRQRGYATRALQLLLPQARSEGLAFVKLTSDVDNIASRRVIEANVGELIERFQKSPEYGGAESLRFRIFLEKTAA